MESARVSENELVFEFPRERGAGLTNGARKAPLVAAQLCAWSGGQSA